MPKNVLNSSSDPQVAEALSILEKLRNVPPQHATAETVAEYKRAVELLAHEAGSGIWCEAQERLGSHLLESPHGDQATNIDSARHAYRAIFERFSPQSGAEEWVVGASGLANALIRHPAVTLAEFAEASALFEQLIEYSRAGTDIGQLALLLGNCARMHASVRVGDVDANLDRAIALQEEALRLLANSPAPQHVVLRARGWHNLATHYMNRRTGLRSQNVDRAVRALERALADRPADRDPVGRARTLRGLAIAYPEWSGADSLEHARQLAEASAAEAASIEKADPRAAPRATGWAAFERQKSALRENLDNLYKMPVEDRLPWLNSVIGNHRAALDVLPRDSMPVRWAEWMGGLARLLGRLPSLGDWSQVQEAYDCFGQALAAVDRKEQPRLCRELLARWGELAHEIRDFQASAQTYGAAADLSEELLSDFADPDHQWLELELTRGYSLFAAYAAARSGRPDEAVFRAEQERTRSLADVFEAARAMADATERQRDGIESALARVLAAEESLRQLDDRDPEAEIARVHRRLADYAGVDPSLFSSRRTDEAKDAANPVDDERIQLRETLHGERLALRKLIAPARAGGTSRVRALQPDAVREIARASQRTLVYLMATMHGGMAAAVLPDGTCDLLPFEKLTSDLIKTLAFGSRKDPAFVDSATKGESAELGRSLEIVASALGSALMTPLESWLRQKGVARAALVPLGSVGLLPIHVAADDAIEFSYAPSARALSVAANARQGVFTGDVLIVADPGSANAHALPFAVAEARAILHLVAERTSVSAHVGVDASLVRVRDGTRGASCIHLACHGHFRPSEPLASHLLLAGEDRLTLADVFSRRADLSSSRIVTLSACQSGTAESRRAADESLGFPLALMVAGVPGVVSTMWPVDDAAAAFFNIRFYTLLRDGLEPADAVARARKWLRGVRADELEQLVASTRATLEPSDTAADTALSGLWRDFAFGDPGTTPYASPVHWAAFILTGV